MSKRRRDMNWTITVAMRVLVILGYLVGAAESEAMDGEAAARVSLVLAGLVVTAFLFYMVLSDATVAFLRRRRLPGRRSVFSVKG
jgi:predicted cobalt transporter CbtA